MAEAEKQDTRPLIVVVDDMPINIQVLGSILNDEGYRIAAATDGAQALGMIRELRPDLVLLDVMMPGMDGFALCRELKAAPDTGELPVIFITAKTDEEDIAQGFEAGAVDYITKPFNAVELVARIGTHLRLKTALVEQKKLVEELRDALTKVKQLSGLLPICSHCKKIRDDTGYWKVVDEYIERHSEAVFSHSICPECLKRYYPEYADMGDQGKT